MPYAAKGLFRARRGRSVLAAALLSILLAGCKGAAPEARVSKGQGPPRWVLDPTAKGYYSAIGMCGRTLFRKDAVDRAMEDARANLALAIAAQVKVMVLQVTTNTGTQTDQSHVVEVSTSASDIVLEESEIQGLWHDRDGAVDAANTTYAVARIPKSTISRAIRSSGGTAP